MKKVITTLTAAAMFIACGNTSAIDNRTFEIDSLNGQKYVSMGEQPATISFADGRCNANLGGNSIFADYTESKDGKLVLDHHGMTRMAVPEEYREDEFVHAFNAISSYKFDSDTIIFLDADGNELFTAIR